VSGGQFSTFVGSGVLLETKREGMNKRKKERKEERKNEKRKK
jgi:hypothetical protein